MSEENEAPENDVPKYEDTIPSYEDTISTEDKDKVAKYISEPSASLLEAARAGYAEGGTFGFAPRMGASFGAGLEKLAGMPMGEEKFPLVPGVESSENKKLQDLYNEYLEYNKKLNEKAKKDHPGVYYSSMLAGGVVSPLNKVGNIGLGAKTAKEAQLAAQLAKQGAPVTQASMPLKMTLSGLSGARQGTLAGLSQSEDLTDIPQNIEKMGQGALFGGGVGAAIPPIGSAIKGTAGATASGLETIFGPVGERFRQGMRAGSQAAPNLATETGREVAHEGRKMFAKDFIENLRSIIKSNAKDKVQKIQNATADLPANEVDQVLNEVLELDPLKMGSKEAEEFALIREEILRAKEGPMKTEVVRQYTGAPPMQPLASQSDHYLPATPEVMPPQMAPEAPPMPGVDVTPPPPAPPLQLGPGGQNLPVVQPPIEQGQAFRMAPPPPPTPGGFQGYESVHKATINAGDDEAKLLFQQKVQEKLLDEEVLGKNFNDSPIEIEEIPIPGTDKVRLHAKRAVIEEPVDDFKQQAQQLAQEEKEAKRIQDLLDKQQEELAKVKQQQEMDMLKPGFQDIKQEVRSGGRNINRPDELYKLQQLMQEYGNPAAPRMQTKDMQRLSRDTSQKLSGVLKTNVDTASNDQILHAFNNIGEVLNIDPQDLQLPGGVGEKARETALGQIFKLINPENLSDADLVNQEKMQYIAQQLRSISPELSEKFLQNVEKQAEIKLLLKEFSKPYEPSGINPEFNIVRRLATKASYGAGYGLGSQAQKFGAEVAPAVQSSKQLFSKYTPESMQEAANRAFASGDAAVQSFGQVLMKLASADERTRNSMIFVLEQQSGYKTMMDKLFGPEEQKDTQMKDKTLQRFK